MPFRPMRRKRQQLPDDESITILTNHTHGVLAIVGDDGYPYAVPLSYVYNDGHIFFHSSKEGHKIDALRHNDKASFCVVDADNVVPAEFTTYYRSVIAFGTLRLIEDIEEKRHILALLSAKYSPQIGADATHSEIEQGLQRVAILDLAIQHITGKEAIELLRNK